MTRDELERARKYLATAESFAQIWSKDPGQKVGALAVGYQPNLLAFGYNGLPPGLRDTPARLHARDKTERLRLTLHAEVNALANARFEVATLYVTHHPCDSCALHILAARTVRRVVYRVRPDFEAGSWAPRLREAAALLDEGGIELVGVTCLQ